MRKYDKWAAVDDEHIVKQMNRLSVDHEDFRVEAIVPVHIGPARYFLFFSYEEQEDDSWSWG